MQNQNSKNLPSKLACSINVFIIASLYFTSCTPDIEQIKPATLKLIFSKDTVQFDTIFSKLKTPTKRVVVYNPHPHAINIDEIKLDASSKFNLYLNGKNIKQVQNYYLLGKDSIYLLAEAKFDKTITPNPQKVCENIEIRIQDISQKIVLCAYVLNTLFPSGTITSNTTWDTSNVYYIRSVITISPGTLLTVNKGTKLYFSKNAGLLVQGTLHAVGDSSNRIIFSGPRLDKYFANIPAQWKGIVFDENSQNNKIQFCELKNAEHGLICKKNTKIFISNSEFHNYSTKALQGINCKIEAVNCLFYNTQDTCIAIAETGNYHFYNNTMVNQSTFYDYNINHKNIIFSIKNNSTSEVILINNIIWGSLPNEFMADKYHFTFSRNLVKTNIEALQEMDTNYINKDPELVNISQGILIPKIESIVIDKAKTMEKYHDDFLGAKRISPWDIGAYEYYKTTK